MMKQKINRTANTVMAVFCLLIGLALLAGGIYLLVTDADNATCGALVGLGALITVLFACTMYLIVNFDKLRQKAEEKAEREAEARRAERRREADMLRAERQLERQQSSSRAAEFPSAGKADIPQEENAEEEKVKNAG